MQEKNRFFLENIWRKKNVDLIDFFFDRRPKAFWCLCTVVKSQHTLQQSMKIRSQQCPKPKKTMRLKLTSDTITETFIWIFVFIKSNFFSFLIFSSNKNRNEWLYELLTILKLWKIFKTHIFHTSTKTK